MGCPHKKKPFRRPLSAMDLAYLRANIVGVICPLACRCFHLALELTWFDMTRLIIHFHPFIAFQSLLNVSDSKIEFRYKRLFDFFQP